jgi:hypothetical protein
MIIERTCKLPTNIQVNVVIRPLIDFESSSQKCLVASDRQVKLLGKEYTFDSVFEGIERSVIFEKTVRGCLDKCLEGYNFSAIAYGQTVYFFNISECWEDIYNGDKF